MNRVLVTVFDHEAKARAALAELETLSDSNTICMNASAIVAKAAGGAVSVSRTEEPAPESALGATAVGVIVGMLAGGVGVAVGAATGLIVGSIADSVSLAIGRDFIGDVKRTLEPGKTALVVQTTRRTPPRPMRVCRT